eukprot:TRINITY_DN1865_c0_g1_i5.p1 TRINITY_DN1865_c0_g1~~TRINITY_DN1865_c0_g1_i5.p1  ORF type:complete len:342 (+),score=95.52 TRINITY_DN1865_c0_g1_i5:181-1206(+)
MQEHFLQSNHAIACSWSDLSLWCYKCDSYIDDRRFHRLTDALLELRPKIITNDPMKAAIDSFAIRQGQAAHGFTYDRFINELKQGKYQKICVFTGAGISVSAGIPDFRSPGTGLYDKLKSYELPYAEAVFSIDFYQENPEPFYQVAKEIMTVDAKPTLAHYFIRLLDMKGLLHLNFTQNVDVLEELAGVSKEKVVHAHGNVGGATCLSCKTKFDPELMKKHIKEMNILRCQCGGLVKPNVIFFGEKLPDDYFISMTKLTGADLIIVMGTSLKVEPFASMTKMVCNKLPVVCINLENPFKTNPKDYVFIQGQIDNKIKELVQNIGWEADMNTLLAAHNRPKL